MLITFSTKSHASITLFGDIALRLIKIMGHSGTVPSAILAKDIPEALTKLQQALKQQDQTKSRETTEDEEDVVSLKHRALPLIDLLQSAIKNNCDVLWKSQ